MKRRRASLATKRRLLRDKVSDLRLSYKLETPKLAELLADAQGAKTRRATLKDVRQLLDMDTSRGSYSVPEPQSDLPPSDVPYVSSRARKLKMPPSAARFCLLARVPRTKMLTWIAEVC